MKSDLQEKLEFVRKQLREQTAEHDAQVIALRNKMICLMAEMQIKKLDVIIGELDSVK